MATPTPSNPQQPGSASKKAHVTTPSHFGYASPAPRSVPSPAATRKDHAAKTPINHPTASSQGSKTLGSTPMVQNLSQTGMTVSSSPGNHNASFGTPGTLAGLGVDLGTGTPGQLSNLLAGGASMMPTMSEMGLGSGRGKRNEDEERRDKMRKVLKNIGRRKGRVSQASIRSIARRVGLTVDIDGESPEEQARNIGNRTLAIAGQKILVDVTLKNHVAQSVPVNLFGDKSDLSEFADPAGKVLLNDLTVPDNILLHSNLDRFGKNLNRLARMDVLGATNKVSCFDAIHGLYKSLDKLYEMEKEAEKAKQTSGVANADAQAAEQVLCKRSGRPTVHANGRIGLALEYWSPVKDAAASKADAMEVDSASSSQAPTDNPISIYKLQIEAEGAPATMHGALRVSDSWLPDTFVLPTPESGESIPWEEPPPTYMANTSGEGHGNGMALDGSHHRVPDLRFVAKLDPPVVLPWNMVNMLSEIGLEVPPIGQVPDFYETLLDTHMQIRPIQNGPIEEEKKVFTLRNGQEADVTHRYTLDVSKPEHGYKLEKLYFSHPRQLVNILPALRQWAHIGALMHSAFGSRATAGANVHAVTDGKPANGISSGAAGDSMDVDDSNQQIDKLLVNVGLSIVPQPALSVTFPNTADQAVSNTVVQVLPNADLVVTNHEGVGETGDSPIADGTQTERAKKVGKALALCSDLGVWIEWMRQS